MISGKTIALNAHLLSGDSSFRSAGIHSYIYHTIAHLPEAAPETEFLIYLGSGDAPTAEHLELNRSRLNTEKAPGRIFFEQVLLPFHLGKLKPDLFHGMAFSLPVGWRGSSVVTVFDLSFKSHPERLTSSRRTYLNTITKLSTRKADRIVTISSFIRNELISTYGLSEDRIDIAYPGVGTSFAPLDQEKIASFRGKKQLPERFLLYLGTLEPRKNLEMLIEAYAASRLRGEIKLILAGSKGWMIDPLLDKIDGLNLTNDVLLPGYVDKSEIALWYNAAEAFIFPSLYEGFGMPIIEAMACGKPVLASSSTSLPEAAGDAGILLPPDDPDSWTKAMEMIVENQELCAKLAAKGVEHARQFNWKNTAISMVSCYEKTLS